MECAPILSEGRVDWPCRVHRHTDLQEIVRLSAILTGRPPPYIAPGENRGQSRRDPFHQYSRLKMIFTLYGSRLREGVKRVRCHDFREMADSYLSDELLTETNHDMINHLESCAECRRELTARRNLRLNLRASFARADTLRTRDEFADNLRRELRVLALRGTKHSAP